MLLSKSRVCIVPVAAARRRVVVVVRRWLGIAVPKRNEERERAALVRRALDLNLAAEQARDLPTNGQPETGAAVLAVRRAVGLLERFEDQLLRVLRNADAGVRDFERNNICLIQTAAREPAFLVDAPHGERHASAIGELERIREQVLDHLL